MEKFDMTLEPVRAFLQQVGAFLPRLLIAMLILLVGFLIAKAVRFALEKGLRAINFHIVTQRSGLDNFLKKGGATADTISLLGMLVYWLVILIALIVAFNGMGLTNVTDLLTRVMLFVPKVIVSLLILAFGSYFARFVSQAVISYCRGIGIRDADSLGKLARYAIMVFVVMIAVDQMDIGGSLIRESFLILLGGLVFALALAFGLGGRRWAATLLERWWPASKRDDLP